MRFLLPRRLVALAVLCASLAATAVAQPAIVYVNQNAAGATHDGSSWTTAYPELRDALAALPPTGPAAEIWIAKGTYKPTAGTDRLATFALRSNLAIRGGFAGGEAAAAN